MMMREKEKRKRGGKRQKERETERRRMTRLHCKHSVYNNYIDMYMHKLRILPGKSQTLGILVSGGSLKEVLGQTKGLPLKNVLE